jgi:RHS repeat-associated protein
VAHYFNKSGTETLRTEYSYDLLDNITQMRDYQVANGTATLYRLAAYEYDFLNRLIGYAEVDGPAVPTAAQIQAAQVKYTYDIDDNLIRIDYPPAQSNKVKGLTYSYNANKWLTGIRAITASGEKKLRDYSYDSLGKVKEIKDYRDFMDDYTAYTVRKHTYDAYERPIKIEYSDSSNPGTVLESYTYAFDRNSNIVSEKIKNNYPAAAERMDQVRTHTYDSLGRLTATKITDSVAGSTSNTAYTYDAVGNRIKEVKDGVQTDYAYNELNQLTSAQEKVISTGEVKSKRTYAYDKNGNEISESDSVSGRAKTYAYDPDNRLSSYTAKAGQTVLLTQQNLYNGSGQCVRKTETGTVTKYYYSEGSVLYTTNAAGGVTALNLNGLDENVIASARGTGAAEVYDFYHKDVRESTTNVISPSGEGIVSYDYTDFGETTIRGETDFYNEICYTGGIYDKSTELYYLNARYYNPADGRFLTEDSYRGDAGDPDSMHLYAYCQNNPVTYSDPSGHWIWAAAGALFGAYDGYKYAKKNKLTGWKKVGAIVGGAVLGAVPVTKVFKAAKTVFKGVKTAFKAVSAAKKVSKVSRIISKPTTTKVVRKVATKSKRVTVQVTRKNCLRSKNVSNGGCFTAGTEISTPSGTDPIEDIELGDYVWSENAETGDTSAKLCFVKFFFRFQRQEFSGLIPKIFGFERQPFFIAIAYVFIKSSPLSSLTRSPFFCFGL